MEKRYKGLANIGATCYMNSLLQTLFMTPEFRYGIYKWNYNPKFHPKQSDSIIYQIQKLFAKLQTDFPNQVTPKQLVKSFQWEDEEAQMQQDIQQFNRLLFEALQKSLSTKSEKYIHQNFVKDFFEGELIHYTRCHECQNQSAREEFFQDVIITVKNIYEKVYNQKLELGIQRYLKPQILDENNLYDCGNCGKKTKASRGARFIKMPSLLNIIFQRFTFNYFTMERQKINDRVEFPFILNFNDYIHGYDQIPNKLNEDSSEYFKTSQVNGGMNGKRTAPNLSSRTATTKSTAVKKSTVPSVAGKTTTKPSANTKGFLAEMRKRKKLNEGENEDLFFVNGTTVASQSKSEVYNNLQAQTIKLTEQQSSTKNGTNENSKQEEGQKVVNSQKITELKHPQIPNLSQTLLIPPPPLNILPNDLTIPFKVPETNNQTESTIELELEKKINQSKKLQVQKQQQLLQLQAKNKKLIEQYLKQGPLVYQLYAVLVHNGTANAGHYYSYIKSFEDDKWYCFNDQRVTLINVLEIQKTFGNANSNAYALYYRMLGSQHLQNSASQNNPLTLLEKLKVQIPSYIKERLQAQRSQIKQKQQQKMQNLQNLIILKICYQLYVKQLEIYKSNSLDLVVEKARQLFAISPEVKKENVRLRMFNPATETKLQTFGGRSHLSLEELKIGSYKSLLLQVKSDHEQFEEYQAGTVILRIALIEENKNLNSLDQIHLKIHKININKNQTIEGIIQIITQKRSQILSQVENIPLCLIKRHQNNDETIHEIISIKENLDKNIEDLTILQNQILFVQPWSQNLIWPLEFENQIFRISIKYNKPGTTDFLTYLTDSRLKVGALKNQLCMFLEVHPDDIIMKMGTKSGRQLKDMEITLKEARFITGTQVYFDFGIPARPGEIRIQLFLATHASSDVFNRLHEFEYLTDVPISGTLKANEVKEKFIPVVKKIKGMQLKVNEFRIRERVSDKIGKIYREKPMKEQQLIEKREIAIELIPDQGMDQKDFSIYFRVWDQQNWTLSDKIQLVVSKNTTVKQLSSFLSTNETKKIIKDPNEMCICRILSIHKFNIIDLTEMEWFTMNQDVSVIGEPMFVNADGLLYIVKNGSEEHRELTKEEEKKFGGTIKPIIIRNKPRTQQKEAKSMKIKVIQKEIQPEELKQKTNLENKEQKTQKINQNQTE